MKTGFPKIVAGLLPIFFLCGGCATDWTHVPPIDADKPYEPSSGVYRGVRFYGRCIAHAVPDLEYSDDTVPIGGVAGNVIEAGVDTFDVGFCIIDLPLSAAADTLILPYDLTTIHNSNEDSDQ